MERSHNDPLEAGLRFRLRRAAKQIGEQHRQIEGVRLDLEAALGAGARADLEALLARFREAIGAHFALEEDVFFPALHGLHPDRSEQLERLSSEHAIFRDMLEGLGRRFDGQALEGFGASFQELVKSLAVHETQEEQLVRELARLSGGT